ncbi:MAG: ParB/RepB/Spo0J family partition protein, partial [Leeuwenhoekiella sp.]
IANDQESLEMALVENIQREDLDPIEIALSYQRLIDEINLTQEQMSDRVGKNRSTIANYLRLLKLDPIIQTGMRDGFLSMGHGRALITIENTSHQLDIYEKIIENSLSVRATETLVKNYREKTNKGKIDVKSAVPEFVKKGKKEFAEYLGAKVDVKVAQKGNGKLIIPFSSEEDFKRIQKLIQGAQ